MLEEFVTRESSGKLGMDFEREVASVLIPFWYGNREARYENGLPNRIAAVTIVPRHPYNLFRISCLDYPCP
jgi:hypothetical protein